MNDERTPLGRVIEAAQHEHGWSNNQLGERAKTLGLKGLTKSNISNLKRDQQQQLSTNTLKNLAILIQVPERVVVEAAIRSTNLEYPERNTAGAAEAIENDLHITARDKRILLAAISAMTEEAGDGDGEASPLTDAGWTPATQTDFRWGRAAEIRDIDEHPSMERRSERSRPGRRTTRSAVDGKYRSVEATQKEADQMPVEEIMQNAAYEPGTSESEDGR